MWVEFLLFFFEYKLKTLFFCHRFPVAVFCLIYACLICYLQIDYLFI